MDMLSPAIALRVTARTASRLWLDVLSEPDVIPRRSTKIPSLLLTDSAMLVYEEIDNVPGITACTPEAFAVSYRLAHGSRVTDPITQIAAVRVPW